MRRFDEKGEKIKEIWLQTEFVSRRERSKETGYHMGWSIWFKFMGWFKVDAKRVKNRKLKAVR
jgi:hypothetical protein